MGKLLCGIGRKVSRVDLNNANDETIVGAASLGMEMTTADYYRLIANASSRRLVADADGGK